MSIVLWFAVIVLSAEAVFFGNDSALLAGLVIAVIGILLETRIGE